MQTAHIPHRQPVPVRVSITLPYRVFTALTNRADEEGRSTSNLGAFLLEQVLSADTEKPAQGRPVERW